MSDRKKASLTDIGKKYSLDISMSGEHDMLCELNLILSANAGGRGVEFLKEILDNLSSVLLGQLEEYEFGYDATIIEFRKNQTIINYNYFEDELPIESESIYNLVKDWYEELKV